MEVTMGNKIKAHLIQKHGTSEYWNDHSNYIPLEGELIIYSDLNQIKIGNGSTAVEQLEFLKGESSSSSSNDNQTVFQDAIIDYHTYKNFRPLLIGFDNKGATPPSFQDVDDKAYTFSNLYVQPSSGSLYSEAINTNEIQLPSNGIIKFGDKGINAINVDNSNSVVIDAITINNINNGSIEYNNDNNDLIIRANSIASNNLLIRETTENFIIDSENGLIKVNNLDIEQNVEANQIKANKIIGGIVFKSLNNRDENIIQLNQLPFGYYYYDAINSNKMFNTTQIPLSNLSEINFSLKNLEVENSDSSQINQYQEIIDYDNYNIYYRTKTEDNGWNSWNSIFNNRKNNNTLFYTNINYNEENGSIRLSPNCYYYINNILNVSNPVGLFELQENEHYVQTYIYFYKCYNFKTINNFINNINSDSLIAEYLSKLTLLQDMLSDIYIDSSTYDSYKNINSSNYNLDNMYIKVTLQYYSGSVSNNRDNFLIGHIDFLKSRKTIKLEQPIEGGSMS